MTTQIYIVAGQPFEGRKDLEREIKRHVHSLPLNIMTKEPFLAAVINEHHGRLREAGQKASGYFWYVTGGLMAEEFPTLAQRWRGGRALLCYLTPMNHWRPVTVYPWRRSNPKAHAKGILRGKIAPYLPQHAPNEVCAVPGCGATWGLQCDHVSPTFNEIADECLKLISLDALEAEWQRRKYLFEDDDPVDIIPDSHPVIQKLFELHKKAELRWLCPEHHRERHQKTGILSPKQILCKQNLEG